MSTPATWHTGREGENKVANTNKRPKSGNESLNSTHLRFGTLCPAQTHDPSPQQQVAAKPTKTQKRIANIPKENCAVRRQSPHKQPFHTFKKSSGATRRRRGVSSAWQNVSNGRASAPPEDAAKIGVSTSRKSCSPKTRRMVCSTCARVWKMRRVLSRFTRRSTWRWRYRISCTSTTRENDDEGTFMRVSSFFFFHSSRAVTSCCGSPRTGSVALRGKLRQHGARMCSDRGMKLNSPVPDFPGNPSTPVSPNPMDVQAYHNTVQSK